MVGIKRIKIILGIFIPFCVFFLMSQNTFAANVWVNNPSFNYWTLTYNQALPGNGITRFQTDSTPPFNILGRPSSYTNYLVGMTVNAIDVSGYTYDSFTTYYMDFQLRVQGGNGNYIYFPNVPSYTKFVVDNYSSTCDIDSSSNQLYYQYHCAVSLPENHIPHYLYLDIGEPYSTGAPFSAVAGINSNDSSGVVIKMTYLGYGFDTQPNQTNQYLDVLSQQNQTIINQNQTIINNQNQNTSDIINNQSDNTDAIINNQNENTDAIIKSNQNCVTYDKTFTSSDITIPSKILNEEGSQVSNGGWGIIQFSPIFPNLTYDYSSNQGGRLPSLCFYDENKSLISCIAYNNRQNFQFNSPSNAKFISLSIVKQDSITIRVHSDEEVCTNYNEQYYDEQRQADRNISNQSSSDIDGAENQSTTNLIGVLSGFVSAFSNINATNCNLTLEFPDYAGGTRVVNICSGKEKAPRIVEIGSSLLLIGVFVPLAYILIRMIYNEIRSWTNG